MQTALRFFGLRGDVTPRRAALGSALFVLSALLLVSGVPFLQVIGVAGWLLGAFLAIRGWLRVARARRARHDSR